VGLCNCKLDSIFVHKTEQESTPRPRRGRPCSLRLRPRCLKGIRRQRCTGSCTWACDMTKLLKMRCGFVGMMLFIATLSPIRRTACARSQFRGCSSTTNAHSETGQMAVCCQNPTLGALSSGDVARRLMLIAKRDKWQFVVKTQR
jgi:hypothetical protein